MNNRIRDVVFPIGYRWIIQQSWFGFDEFTAFQPWYLLEDTKQFVVTDRWPDGLFPGILMAFARRQDNDELACFVIESKKVTQIVVVNGWTSSGYDILQTHNDFWDWMRSIIDDVAVWAENT